MKTLVYTIGTIGDTVLILPIISYLIKSRPELTIIFESRNNLSYSARDVYELFYDNLRYISVESGFDKFNKLLQIFKLFFYIRKNKYNEIFYLAPSDRSNYQILRDKLFFRLCGVNNLCGFDYNQTGIRHPRDFSGNLLGVKNELFSIADRLNLDKKILCEDHLSLLGNFSSLSGLPNYSDEPYVILAPGCKQKANRLPLYKWMEITKYILTLGYKVYLVGSSDAEFVASKLSNIDNVVSYVNRSDLKHFCKLSIGAKLFIGLDTGTTHLASLLNVPTLALYGQRDNPGRFYPLGENTLVLQSDPVFCQGCMIRIDRCPLPEHPCMSRISNSIIFEEIKKRL